MSLTRLQVNRKEEETIWSGKCLPAYVRELLTFQTGTGRLALTPFVLLLDQNNSGVPKHTNSSFVFFFHTNANIIGRAQNFPVSKGWWLRLGLESTWEHTLGRVCGSVSERFNWGENVHCPLAVLPTSLWAPAFIHLSPRPNSEAVWSAVHAPAVMPSPPWWSAPANCEPQ